MTEITSRTNENVKHVSGLACDRRARREARAAVLETPKLILDAVAQGVRLEELWLSQRALDRGFFDVNQLESAGVRVFLVPEEVLSKMSEQRTPQGAIALAELPKERTLQDLFGSTRLLLLDGIQDPGNLGAAVRSAAAFGFEGVLVDRGCADLFSPKALRASMGAAFRMPSAEVSDAAEAAKELAEAGFEVFGAALRPDARDVRLMAPPQKLVLAIGSEGSGLSEALLKRCTATVVIPLMNGVESLNAASAAAVLMWIFRSCHGEGQN